MPRRNHITRQRRTTLGNRFDRDYVNLPEYPQYTTVTVIPMKTIFVNMDASPRANDFYVCRSYSDKVFKKLAKHINMGEVIA